MAHQYGVPQKRKRVIILCVRKDLDLLPKDIYPDFITPNDDRQITAYDTIADLESIECSNGVQYIPTHTSPLIKFFKREISVSEYLSMIKDERGVILENADKLDDDTEEPELEAEEARPLNVQKNKPKPSNEDNKQLSFFDI